jgi:hypothetical protein
LFHNMANFGKCDLKLFWVSYGFTLTRKVPAQCNRYAIVSFTIE